MKMCPCNSKKPYDQCCAIYHQGKDPENALLLMRSRYAAYVEKHPDYILKTTHPENPQREHHEELWKRRIIEFSEITDFKNLHILNFQDGEKEAFVIFTAHMFQKGEDITFTEKSQFLKEDGKWLYYNGEIKWGKADVADFIKTDKT